MTNSDVDSIILSQFGPDNTLIPPDLAKIYPGFDYIKCKHPGKNSKDCGSVPGGGVCARPGINLPKHNLDRFVCCPPGSDYHLYDFHRYCTMIPEGFFCKSNAMCKNGGCGHLGDASDSKICCPSGESYYHAGDARFFCRGSKPGAKCRSDAGCSTDNCVNGVCSDQRKKSAWEDVKWILLGILAFAVVIMIIVLAVKF